MDLSRPESDFLDRPAAVREGEELDLASLRAWLSGRMPLEGELALHQYPKGYSNLTYGLRCGDKEYILRRPPFGSKVATAHDMGREFRVLSALHPVYAKAPRPLLFCEDVAVLGAPFYVMEKVEGVILRPRMPVAMHPSPETMAGIADALVESLAELHAVDVGAAGLGDFGKPEGYVRRQVEGWIKRYEAARTDEVPAMDRAARWLVANMPGESGVSLIHNDFKYDNLVLDPTDWTRVRAVLDWEMATLGDPLMDLGTTLAYWVHPGDPPPMQQMALSPTVLPGNPSREELLQRYAERSGLNPGNGVFYYVYGLYKVAVIVQQIYARYKRGLTSDPRFANLHLVVQGCAASAALALDKGRMDRLWE